MLNESNFQRNQYQVQCSQVLANRMANNRRNMDQHVNNCDMYFVEKVRENDGIRNIFLRVYANANTHILINSKSKVAKLWRHFHNVV